MGVQLDVLLWFNHGKCRENTSVNIVWYMIMHFALYAMVKTAHVGDLNVHANLVYELDVYHQHLLELVQSAKMPSGLTRGKTIVFISWLND